MAKIKRDAMPFGFETEDDLFKKIQELHEAGWQITAATPLAYCKPIGASLFGRISKVLLIMVREED